MSSNVFGTVLRLARPMGAREMSGKTKIVQLRMKSVTNIQKITKSMKMVAASKLKNLQTNCENARPFTRVALKPFNEASEDIEVKEGEKRMLVVITSDRGLCGGVNSAIVKQARLLVAADKEAGIQTELFIGGDKGRVALRRDQSSRIVGTAWDITKKAPNFSTAMFLAEQVMEHEHDMGTIQYNQFKSVMSQVPTTQNMISYSGVLKANMFEEFEFDTSKEETLKNMHEFYVACSVYNALLENNTSETASRMSAMESASTNAEEVLGKLTTLYNKVRQAGITAELIEIISGAEQVAE